MKKPKGKKGSYHKALIKGSQKIEMVEKKLPLVKQKDRKKK
jgi:hypothetical protein